MTQFSVFNPTPSKSRGFFRNVLCMDCETSGIAQGQPDPTINLKTGDRYQAVSWGMLVADSVTLDIKDQLYVEIKFDDTKYQWDGGAEQVHGLSRDYLNEYGVPMSEAVLQIGEFILRHWGPDAQINVMGTNVVGFDLPFLRATMATEGIHLRFSHRHIDTTSFGIGLMGYYNAEEMQHGLGVSRVTPDGKHNALEDIFMEVETVKRIREYVRALEESYNQN